ncbi:MAG: Nicotinamide-nucleotide amidohydrolase PncC [Syntrophorhabdus sp. PtaU1.Bin058]|nr:MAG: Nicotinamide-nucleotide amidohydrolase PncC [Syntrophorhabdus sp. PtaU1.Bin058]
MVLEEKIGNLLLQQKKSIAVAESCTGGLVAHRITNVPGASGYFEAGFVTYSNKAKEHFLSVPEAIIKAKGAVSEEVARSMAGGVRKAAGVDIGLAITGIAGPGGGTPEKPVGTVYIALAVPEGISVRRFSFQGDRSEIKLGTSEAALSLILDYLEGRLG